MGMQTIDIANSPNALRSASARASSPKSTAALNPENAALPVAVLTSMRNGSCGSPGRSPLGRDSCHGHRCAYRIRITIVAFSCGCERERGERTREAFVRLQRRAGRRLVIGVRPNPTGDRGSRRHAELAERHNQPRNMPPCRDRRDYEEVELFDDRQSQLPFATARNLSRARPPGAGPCPKRQRRRGANTRDTDGASSSRPLPPP